MTDLEVVVEQLLGPVRGVDGQLLAGALAAELDRLADAGSFGLPAEAVIDVDRLRIDAGSIAWDRLADPATTAVLLARVIVDALRGNGHG